MKKKNLPQPKQEIKWMQCRLGELGNRVGPLKNPVKMFVNLKIKAAKLDATNRKD